MNWSAEVTRSPCAPKALATSPKGTSRNSLASGHISVVHVFLHVIFKRQRAVVHHNGNGWKFQAQRGFEIGQVVAEAAIAGQA